MDLEKRRSPRIPGYDYSTPDYYFITICTYHKKCIFGKPGRLNCYGKIAEECLLKIQELHRNIRVDKYVVMPNHIHAILVLNTHQECEQKDISTVIGQYKMTVTKMIRMKEPGKMVWQRSFHDHIIRNQKRYELIWMYIQNNPLKWEDDGFYVDDCEL